MLLYILLGLVVFVSLYFACAFVLSRIPVKAQQQPDKNIQLYLTSNGVHTDLVVPVKNTHFDWSNWVSVSHTRKKDTLVKYVAFGWGDRGFYLQTPTWADLTARVAFRAAFGLSTAAIHATFYKQLSEGPYCKSLYVSEAQYLELVKFITASFKVDAFGKPMVINTEARYGSNDAFYEALGSYSLFYTCNTWTNNGLKAAGQKAAFWTPFYKGIFYHYP